jgi:hypothetical protein
MTHSTIIVLITIILSLVSYGVQTVSNVVASEGISVGQKFHNCSTLVPDGALFNSNATLSYLPSYLRYSNMYFFQCQSIYSPKAKFMIQSHDTDDICKQVPDDEQCQREFCDSPYSKRKFSDGKLLACMHCKGQNTLLRRIYENNCSATSLHFSRYDHLCGYNENTWNIQNGIPEFRPTGWLIGPRCYCPKYDSVQDVCTERTLRLRGFFFISHYILWAMDIFSMTLLMVTILIPFVVRVVRNNKGSIKDIAAGILNIRFAIMIMVIITLSVNMVEAIVTVTANTFSDIFRGCSYLLLFIAELLIVILWINILSHIQESDTDMALSVKMKVILTVAVILLVLPLLFLIISGIGISLMNKVMVMLGDLTTLILIMVIMNSIFVAFLIYGTKLYLYIRKTSLSDNKGILDMKFTRFMIINSTVLFTTNILFVFYVSLSV